MQQWEFDLLTYLGFEKKFPEWVFDSWLLLNLTSYEIKILSYRFKDKMTYSSIAEKISLSSLKVRQSINASVSKLKAKLYQL